MTEKQTTLLKLLGSLALLAMTGITIGTGTEAYVYAAF